MSDNWSGCAWVIGFIDIRVNPPMVLGAGVYLMPEPPTEVGVVPFILKEFRGSGSCVTTVKAAESHLSQPHYGWLGGLSLDWGATPLPLWRRQRAAGGLPQWAQCLLLNLASVVWFASGMQAERETTITELLDYSDWKAQGVCGGGMSGSVPIPGPAHWVVERGKLEATNPLYIEEGRGLGESAYASVAPPRPKPGFLYYSLSKVEE